jgi:hypothetical protein
MHIMEPVDLFERYLAKAERAMVEKSSAVAAE